MHVSLFRSIGRFLAILALGLSVATTPAVARGGGGGSFHGGGGGFHGGFGGRGFHNGFGGGGFSFNGRSPLRADLPTLKAVADRTGGKAYAAQDAGELQKVYIGSPGCLTRIASVQPCARRRWYAARLSGFSRASRSHDFVG